MANRLLEIQPHVVSRDLRGYSVFFYGQPKSGKTTIASHFPGAFLLAFEKGYNAIPGIMAFPMNSWGEFKRVLTDLKDPDVKAKFQTIVIDTADIAYGYCEDYICNTQSDEDHDYDKIADIPYGAGYKMAQKEFDTAIRKILQMDYGLVLISHEQDKSFKDENGKEFNQIIPTIDNKGRLVCERTCDIIGYSRIVQNDDGTVSPKLFLRGTPRFIAGGRFKYIAPVIDFNYDSLTAAIADAVDKEASEHSNQFVSNDKVNLYLHDKPKISSIKTLQDEFRGIVGNLMTKNASNSTIIQGIVDKYLGKGKKVSECTDAQAELVSYIISELQELKI